MNVVSIAIIYYIYRNSSGSECRKHDLPADFKIPMVWDFLKKAHGDKHKDPRTGMMIDRWTFAVVRQPLIFTHHIIFHVLNILNIVLRT